MIFEKINIIDLISILIILLSILASTWRGFIREIMTIFILVLSFFISYLLFDYSSNITKNFIQIDILVQLIGWVFPFIISIIFFSLINNIILLPLLLKFSSIYDHILGSIFGLARGILLICLIYIGMIHIIESFEKLPNEVKNSYTVNISNSLSKYLIPILPFVDKKSLKKN